MNSRLQDQLQAALGPAYVLERELGGGGMSHVFLAHETALGRKVVVKVLLPELAAGVNVERFRREIQLAAQLQHPHIVPLLSAGEADGLPFFIMPFVTGESLRARVQREGELPIPEVVRILRDVVSALAYAHARGVMHRDVKPDNVLLSGGVAVVTDFGVAKAVSASSDLSPAAGGGVTSLGVALGTPAYMAPEQATASPLTDHRADIYALGIMTYEMLTGLPPFTGRSPQAVLAAHVVEEPHPVESRRPAVPPALATLVKECLAKRPADRPQSAAELLHTLDAIATPSGGTAPTRAVHAPVTVSSPLQPARTPRRWGLALTLAVVAGALVGGGALLFRRVPPAAVVPAAAPPTAVVPPATVPPISDSAVPGPAGAAAPSTEAPHVVPKPEPHNERRRAAAATNRRARDTAVTPPPAPSVAESAVSLAPSPTRVPVDTPATPAPAQPTMAPAPAPPARAPAPISPGPPAPPVPPADPRPEIRNLIAAYARAVEAGSVSDLRRLYPGMTAAQQLGWEDFFRLVRDVKADLTLGRLDLTNETGAAQVTGTYTYLNTSSQLTERQPVSFSATLRREGGRWRITEIR